MTRSSKAKPFISVLVPAHQAGELLEENIPKLHSFFSSRFRGRFEIILVPNPVLSDIQTRRAAQRLSALYPQVKTCLTSTRPGKGMALKEGFGMARGSRIFTTDADLPYDLVFFQEAERMLDLGFDLVIGNRRLPTSRFQMSKKVLHLVYQRVLLGLLFNFMIRLLFPIHTTDTQAGIKAMTRDLADEVFRRQVCPRFSYDLEMILTAQGLGRKIAELPVLLHLKNERSTILIFRTACHAAYWVCVIAVRQWKGRYSLAR